MKSSGVVGFGLLAAALEGGFLLLRRLDPWDQHVPEVIAVALAAGALYLVGVYRVLRAPLADARPILLVILTAAIVFRLTLVGAAPTLSDDLYRYQWEGRIQVAGWNPYLVTPADPRLAELRDSNFARLPGPHIPTVYPPLAELYFYGLGLLAHELAAFKWAAVGLDLAALGMLLLLLGACGQPPVRVLIYAWCPLVVMEFAGSGHYDALALVTLLLANLLIIRKRPGASMAALAAATLAKWFAGLALPVFAVRSRWRWLAAFAGTGVLLTLPYAGAGRGLLRGLEAYAEQYRNNESLFALLSWASGRDDVAAGLALGIVVGLALHAARQRTEPLRACYWLVGATLLLAPSVFPWYVTWLVPFLCFYPNPAGLLFTVTVLLSHHVVTGYRASGVWHYEPWVVALEYVPVYALLVGGRLKSAFSGGGIDRARPAASPRS